MKYFTLLLVVMSLLPFSLQQEGGDGDWDSGGNEKDYKDGQNGMNIQNYLMLIAFVVCFSIKKCFELLNSQNSETQEIRQQYMLTADKINHDAHHQTAFQQILKQFRTNLQIAQKQGNFLFYQKDRQYAVQLKKIQINPNQKDKFIYQIELQGIDYFGQWKGYGNFFMNQENKPFFWMRKIYLDKQKAKQTGSYSILLYETTKINDNIIQGIWFFKDKRSQADYSGIWTIKNSNLTQINQDRNKQNQKQRNHKNSNKERQKGYNKNK